MIKLFLTIIFFLSLPFLSYADSTDNIHEKFTPEQKKEIAKFTGIILIGMTKQDVKETFSFTEPKIHFTPEGQEVWYYKTPEEQNIYFNNDEVEDVEYFPSEKQKFPPAKKQKFDM